MTISNIQGQDEFDEAARVVSWNKRLLTTLGIWPQKPSELCFAINFGYFVYHMTLEYLDLCLFIGDLEHVIMNLTENMAFSQILIRIAMLRLYNNRLGGVINEALKDFNVRNYKTPEEIKAFIKYNARSKVFVKLLIAFVVLTATSYYVKPLTGEPPEELAKIYVKDNVTVKYLLPYRFHIFYPIENSQTYILTYLSQLPFVFVSGFGQSAADCLMVTLVFHVCGQMSILAMRITKLSSEENICDEELRGIVKDHKRLLQMGKTIEEAFSETLLGHLIGATSLVCILGYQVLTISMKNTSKSKRHVYESTYAEMNKIGEIHEGDFLNFAKGQNADLATFITFAFLVLLVLYAHCTVGESLITESLNVCNAFYDCDWYNMPPKRARIIILCMARSQKPLCLTAGKFGIFCLSTLTEVLKTAMGYLSVLRSFL